MPTESCRFCHHPFHSKPLLRFENFPAAAQNMPDETNLHLDKGVTLEVFECESCGVVQLNNDPVSYYREVIRAVAYSEEMKAFRLKQFSEFLQKYRLEGKLVFELGAGKGEFLALMQECGAKAIGIEYAKSSVEEAQKTGLHVFQGYIEKEQESLLDAPYDAFFVLNFFEHLPEPMNVLNCLRKNLTDNGVGLIEVPNFDMILKKKMFSEFIPDHLFYFTKDSLKRVLEMSGFEVLECKEIWHDYIISAEVRKRAKLDISHFYTYQEKMKNEINVFVDKFSPQSVGIWGAGHQSLALISLSSLKGKIKYIVDSAPFKQGKYSPASHIKIVPPSTLKDNPVEALIIMAASYSDEVASIVKRDYPQMKNMAILRDDGLELVSEL